MKELWRWKHLPMWAGVALIAVAGFVGPSIVPAQYYEDDDAFDWEWDNEWGVDTDDDYDDWGYDDYDYTQDWEDNQLYEGDWWDYGDWYEEEVGVADYGYDYDDDLYDGDYYDAYDYDYDYWTDDWYDDEWYDWF